MGWKSTITLSREDAMSAIHSRLDNASNEELSDTLTSLGFGDNIDLPYYGRNFIITDNPEDNDW